jgi:hypothetical protein
MSTAILISGQLRTFAKCWPTQRWHVLRHFADPHFFVCVQHQEDAHQHLAPLFAEYGSDRVHTEFRTDPDLSAHLTPELTVAYHRAPYANAAPAHQLLLQHWYQREVWRFFSRLAEDTDHAPADSLCRKKFDTIIRLRGDLWFHSFDISESAIRNLQSAICLTPWWGRFGGINDRFAVMGPEAARYYFTVWDHIPELLAAGCPFHPESLVRANLERGAVDIHETLRTEFSTLRLNGEQRWPEITSVDLAHAALRAA